MSINLHTTSKRVSDFSIMPRRKSNLNNACTKDKLRMRVKRCHESEVEIAARNNRLWARVAPIKEGRSVKIFTDNSVEIIGWNYHSKPRGKSPFTNANQYHGLDVLLTSIFWILYSQRSLKQLVYARDFIQECQQHRTINLGGPEDKNPND